MIAMALACEPKLLIADEPTTALDVTVQAQILDLLKDITRDAGLALILITHNVGIVARYADRIAVMYGGRIISPGQRAISLSVPCLEVTNRPYGESEQDGAQCNSDHERPDREAESALTGRFNHECPRIAPGDVITANYNAESPFGFNVIRSHQRTGPGCHVLRPLLL